MKQSAIRAPRPRLAFETPGDVFNATPPRIVFGAGTSRAVADEVARLGAKRALVVCTPGRRALGERVAERLGAACAGVLAEAVSQVPIELARSARQKASTSDADCLVSIGGGASIGLGKGIALELPLPIIAIPTTYSGSEMTAFCGITIDGVKRMHQHLNMPAHSVIYDPELTLGLPMRASTASAFNALAHCIDGIYVPTISPLHRIAATEGTRAIYHGIRALLEAPQDVDARALLLYGAHIGGAVLAGGFALQHGLAHTLGGSFGVPHGESHAVVLPYVTAFNARFAREEMEAIAGAVGTDNLAGALWDLLRECSLPSRLPDVGIRPDQRDHIVGITVETDNGQNPVPLTAANVGEVVDAAFTGERPR